jgi:topoisomerase-4 subunit A
MIEKYDSPKIWTAVFYDADQGYRYLKRFQLDIASNRKQNFVSDNPDSRLFLLTDEVYPRIEVVFGGNDSFREPLIIDAEEFVGVKGFKAKGKRISMFEIQTINELEPVRFPPEELSSVQVVDNENTGNDEEEQEQEKSNSDIIDEITGQMKLFDE